MADLPDKPEKAAEYVLVFLPGFLCLGLVTYITGTSLSEFGFIYVAIALSIFIHLIVRPLVPWLTILGRRLKVGLSHVAASFTAHMAIALSIAIGISYATESEIVLSVVRSLFPTTFSKVSGSEALTYLVAENRNRRVHLVDDRPLSLRLTSSTEGKDCQLQNYDMWVRIKTGDAIFEGRIKYLTQRSGSDGLPLLLSPVCKMKLDAAGDKVIQVVPGPGVMVYDKTSLVIETLEMMASACARFVFPAADPSPCHEPRINAAGQPKG
jgi:hypothetical protein